MAPSDRTSRLPERTFLVEPEPGERRFDPETRPGRFAAVFRVVWMGSEDPLPGGDGLLGLPGAFGRPRATHVRVDIGRHGPHVGDGGRQPGLNGRRSPSMGGRPCPGGDTVRQREHNATNIHGSKNPRAPTTWAAAGEHVLAPSGCRGAFHFLRRFDGLGTVFWQDGLASRFRRAEATEADRDDVVVDPQCVGSGVAVASRQIGGAERPPTGSDGGRHVCVGHLAAQG